MGFKLLNLRSFRLCRLGQRSFELGYTMDLNDYRDEVKGFLLKINSFGKNQEQKLVWLEKEFDLLKSAVKNSDSKAISHQIYDMMYLLFEIAADNNSDLDSEWINGKKKKDKYIDKEKIIIKKADEDELKQAILLSEKYCYENTPDRSHGFTLRPIDESYFGSVYVAKINEKIVGAACVTDFSKEDYKRYGVSNNSKCKEIGKVTVNEDYRGMKIGSKILKFIFREFPNLNFYATIMEKPVENKASKRLFESLGFKRYKIINLFHEDLNLSEEVGLYVYKN